MSEIRSAMIWSPTILRGWYQTASTAGHIHIGATTSTRASPRTISGLISWPKQSSRTMRSAPTPHPSDFCFTMPRCFRAVSGRCIRRPARLLEPLRARCYKVVYIPFFDGRPSGPMENFLTGFLDRDENAQGRPVGLAVDKTGALLVADDVGGTVWR